MEPEPTTWQRLRLAAEEAHRRAAHERAVMLYSEALAQPDTPWAAAAALRLARAHCWYMRGDFAALDADLTALAGEARAAGDAAVLAAALAEQAFSLRYSADIARCSALAQEAVEAATQAQEAAFGVNAWFVRGVLQVDMGDLDGAEASLAAASALHSPADDQQAIRILILRGYLKVRQGDYQQTLHDGDKVIQLARANAWLRWEIVGLNLLFIAHPDLARRGLLLEQMLETCTQLGNRPDECVARINLGIWYAQFGMQQRAIDQVTQALALGIDLQMQTLYSLQVLSNAYCLLNEPAPTLAYADDGITLARRLNSPLLEYTLLQYQASAHLSLGQVSAALADLAAAQAVLPAEMAVYQPHWIALAALTHRVGGDPAAARTLATQAFALLQAESNHPEWSSADLYWCCYCALAPDRPAGDPAAQQPAPDTLLGELWQVLDAGLQAILAPVATLSDAGLRRSYLHRVWAHRLLIYEWLKWGPACAGAEAVAAFVEQVQRPGRLEEIFRRLLAVGIRLNRQRDPGRLAAQIVEEVAELTGAERIALVIFDRDGRRNAKVSLPAPPPSFALRPGPAAPGPAAFLAEIDPWLAEAARRQEPFVRQIEGGALVEGRSILVAPLIDRGRVLGLIYCDLCACFGRFDAKDMELLGVLANQSAVALENAAASSELASALHELQHANRLKDEFMAAISHELRTPLMGMLSMAELLDTQIDGALTDKQASRVQAIVANGNRLHALIDGILRYTALLAGRVQLQQELCDLDELCAITLSALRPRAAAKGQQIEYTLAPPGVSIWSDPDAVIQVLKQLLDNAIKFTPERGRLGLDVQGDTAAGSVRLAVWDTGPGISVAAQEAIFHPFVQGDGSLARRHGGIGLGLAYAQRMVERLGGALRVQSEPGQGSRFTVTLPLHDSRL